MSFQLKPILLLILLAVALHSCKSPKVVSRPAPPKKEAPRVVATPKPSRPETKTEVKEDVKKENKVEVKEKVKEVIKSEEKTEVVSSFNQSPFVMREFRAAWIATVANINWPSKRGLSTKQQQDEALKLLDFLKAHNYNAVIFQARPQADALYKSHLEPWSYFLSGEVGKAPSPYYDPLQFWIEAAHERGMELHVWLNPYRSHHSTGGEIMPKSLVKTNPELMVSLKNGMWWMDPSKQATQDHSSAVVMDIVKRYDVDGIHFDDYFYPYASYNGGLDFPDTESYQNYIKAGGKLTKPDWRRAAVNGFVKRIYQEIKAEKPEVKFGISPFGIWRPGYPKSIVGMDQYDELFADAKLWLNEGWIDYFTPQLYWKINQVGQSFPILLGWWQTENTQNRHLWPGIRIDYGGDADNVDETINQIMLTRGMVAESKGTAHWSISPLLKYPNLSKALVNGPYRKQALVPASPWLNAKLPEAPVVDTKVEGSKVTVSWSHPNAEAVFNWVVFYKYADDWEYVILDRTKNTFELPLYSEEMDRDLLTRIGVIAVDNTGNQSSFNEVKIGAKLLGEF
ncbi:glycoside hydrolase family 10 protein [Gelidibacter pelagius]|uniref:Family 10 glycosylhydrolase n=1 Tax=Gelidibacter pelagius TaxID=2819985 RepID=A0ABS3SS84_9FLAO|nr:family 10 glycosylhydrolase [Gelidibacter pelagius]MBO3098296.1 family 10 glycosylhydrolase [Gelidibacter pelagius]